MKLNEDVNDEEVAAPKTIRLPVGTINAKNADDDKYTAIGDCWFSRGKTGGFLKCVVKADVELKAKQQLYVFMHSTEYRLGYYQRGETVI